MTCKLINQMFSISSGGTCCNKQRPISLYWFVGSSARLEIRNRPPGQLIDFYNICTFQRDTQCSCTDCSLILRCQLYMFRTVTVHPQELLFRCYMCRLWYVLIRPSGTTFEEAGFGRNIYILQKMIHGPSNVMISIS